MLLHAIFVSMLTSLAGGASNIANELKILTLGLIIVSTAQFEVVVDCQDPSQLFLISPYVLLPLFEQPQINTL